MHKLKTPRDRKRDISPLPWPQQNTSGCKMRMDLSFAQNPVNAKAFFPIISTCTFHFKSFDIITPSNLADGTTSMFVLLIVTGSKVFSDFMNDILSSLHFDSFNWKPSARDCNKFINARLHRAGFVLFHTLSEGSIICILPDVRIRHTQVINHYQK